MKKLSYKAFSLGISLRELKVNDGKDGLVKIIQEESL